MRIQSHENTKTREIQSLAEKVQNENDEILEINNFLIGFKLSMRLIGNNLFLEEMQNLDLAKVVSI